MRKTGVFVSLIFIMLSCGPKPERLYATDEYVVQNMSGQNLTFVVRNLDNEVWESIVMNNSGQHKLKSSISHYYEVDLYFNDEPVLQLEGSDFEAHRLAVREFEFLNIYTVTTNHYNMALQNSVEE